MAKPLHIRTDINRVLLYFVLCEGLAVALFVECIYIFLDLYLTEHVMGLNKRYTFRARYPLFDKFTLLPVDYLALF